MTLVRTDVTAIAWSQDGAIVYEWPNERSDLGPCCRCNTSTSPIHWFVTLPVEGFTYDCGWGCVYCGLATRGAWSVICADCVAEIEARRETEGFHLDLRYFCDGDDSTARLPLWMLDGRREWKHDLSKHEETVQ